LPRFGRSCSIEETEHFITLYRSLVSDLLDPYATLLVACHQFVAGSFAGIEAANFNLDELNKVEFVQSAMQARRHGRIVPRLQFKGPQRDLAHRLTWRHN
jgi:hypothetical protein